MTKTDFAELKEKLGKFDPKPIEDLCNDRWKSYKMFEAYRIIAKESAKEQHTKSAAIISELIEIIKLQSEALESALIICDMVKFGAPASRKQFLATIDQTTTRLQKLREGNNGK